MISMAADRYKENYRANVVNKATLDRWIVNYIRHNLTCYDWALRQTHGRIGKDEVYVIFKKAVLERIAIVYPKYAEECYRQIDEMHNF